MKKAIPAIIAIVLILIIGVVFGGSILREKFAYSTDKVDLNDYFDLTQDNQVAVVLQEERAPFYAIRIDGCCYFDADTVKNYFNEKFYFDESENQIIYVEPLQITRTHIGESGYNTDGNSIATDYIPARYVGETLYIACDYVRLFTNYEYTYYDDPSRMQVYTKWESRNIAHIAKDTQIRYRGGIKSPILKEVSKGDKVQILDEMEEWSGVKTDDGFIGYVENKRLEEYDTEEPIPDTHYTEPEFVQQSLGTKVNLAWHNVASAAGNDTFWSLIENTHGINVISPTWFGLSDNEGGISDFGSASYVQTAHDMGMQVWGLVSNFVNTDIDTYAVLANTGSRTTLINNLMEVAAAYGLDGINVDFENLSVQTGAPFVEFIRELSVECRKAGVILSVDNYVPIGNTDYYNRGQQGIYADYVIIMGYDEHYAGSEETGSVASIGYVTKGIEKTMEEVPAERIINGVPFYTRIWENDAGSVSSQAVGMQTANQYISDHGIDLKWDEETCQNYGEYTSGDVLHQVWLEDAESIEVKLNVMDAHGIAGVASWCLGFETPDIWDVIEKYLNK